MGHHAARSPAQPKYVICNGDEGDPGAFMDRAVLEADPFRVIEGLADRRLRHRSRRRICLCSARIPDRRAPHPRGHRQGRGAGIPGRAYSRQRSSASNCRSARAPARSCAARKRRSSSRSKASAECRVCGLPIRRNQVSGENRRSSTTSRPWPACRGSSAAARRPSPPWERQNPRGPRCFPWSAR